MSYNILTSQAAISPVAKEVSQTQTEEGNSGAGEPKKSKLLGSVFYIACVLVTAGCLVYCWQRYIVSRKSPPGIERVLEKRFGNSDDQYGLP